MAVAYSYISCVRYKPSNKIHMGCVYVACVEYLRVN